MEFAALVVVIIIVASVEPHLRQVLADLVRHDVNGQGRQSGGVDDDFIQQGMDDLKGVGLFPKVQFVQLHFQLGGELLCLLWENLRKQLLKYVLLSQLFMLGEHRETVGGVIISAVCSGRT